MPRLGVLLPESDLLEPGLGFTDDAAVLAAVVGLVSAHITPVHRAASARALDKELPKKE